MIAYLRPGLGLLLCLFVSMAHAQAPEPLSTENDMFRSLTYRNLGPNRGGRVTAVAGVASRPATFYMGSTGGGVWKTEDFGQHWQNISDGFFATPSIGAIRVYQAEPDIIYVGTGSDGLRSNVIAGKGVYKSTDAGQSWQHLGLEKSGQIGAVLIHPEDPDLLYVAAIGQPFQPNPERGVYRSSDGGQSWEQVLYLSDTVGAVDLEFAPDDPDIIYAAMWRAERKPWTIISGGDQTGGRQTGGIYKSSDGGDNWKKVSSGLPQGLIGKADLAVSAADPQRLYALLEAPGEEGGLYRSNDRGESFYLVSNKDGLLDRPFYYCNVDANPLDADVVFVNSTRFYKSTDAGQNWNRMSTPHGDNHDMWFNKNDTSIFIQANDGGANITLNGGKSWSTQHNQPTAELYQVEVDDQYPYWLYAGQQDNSTIAVPSLPPYYAPAGEEGYWMAIGGCETGPVVPKPGNHNIVYANCKGRFGVYNKETGQEKQYYVGATYIYGHNPKNLEYRFQRVAPIHVSPHNPDVVYHGSQFLHKTADDGLTWETISPDLTANDPEKQVVSGAPITRDVTGEEYYSTIYSIRESPLEEGVIWVGANDGPVHLTRDGGKSWQDVTPAGLPEGGRVDSVEPSPHRAGKAYVTILRYQLGDWQPYIYRTEDYGRNWTLINQGIPADYPVRVVREDPDKEGLLYAGTEYGMFVSLNDGAQWQAFQQNLPVTPITDIKVFRQDLVISTMGRGFWIADDISPLHQMAEAEQAGQAFLFQPEDATRYRYRSTRGSAVPAYPQAAVNIDYYLVERPDNPVQLDILDAKGKLIRTFSSATPAQQMMESTSMATGFVTKLGTARLENEQGIHRFRWDMKHAGAWDEDSSRAYQNGPMVAPGRYRVRLKVDGREYTRSFNILPDPRLEEIEQEDILAQEQLLLDIVEMESELKKTVSRLKEKMEEINGMMKDGKRNKRLRKEEEQLSRLYNELVTEEGIYMKPQLISQLRYLRSMLQRADQRPGKDAYRRFDQLKSRWNELRGRMASMDQLDIKVGD
jgi:photosystem II stability/assembly factor-like uncharacterized protein